MNHNFCKHLRTKAMFVGATPVEAFAEKPEGEDRSCHFWCNRTQTVAGLDDQPVHKDACQPGRDCFVE